MSSNDRIPTLDGWRGMAILLVLVEHVQYALTRRTGSPWTSTGQHGVTFFFVLSGYLITSKLLEGPIDLRQFYIRRFFRLMPAAWVFLAYVFLACNSFGIQRATWPEIRACLFFFRNFTGAMSSFTTRHFWSLSVEEQFYLVWPPILLLAGARRGRWIAPAAALAFAAWRFAHWSEYDRVWAAFHTEARADALLIGCTLAFAMNDTRARAALARWAKWFAAPAFAVLLISMARFQLLIPASESVAIALLMAASVTHSHSAWCAWLDARPLMFLGKVSYGVYLWQQVALPYSASMLPYTLGLGLPLVVLISYEYIERPLIRFGHSLAARLSLRPVEPA